jgi:hypothetical protein
MTRDQRKTSRRRILKQSKLVEQVRRGRSVMAVAEREGINPGKLYAACQAAGVLFRRGRPRDYEHWTPKRYAGVDWSRGDREIAEQLNITKQAVQAIRKKLFQRGLIPPRSRSRRTDKQKPATRNEKTRLRPPTPAPPPLRLYERLTRRLARNPYKRSLSLIARVRPYAETAMSLIQQGRVSDRPHTLTGPQVAELVLSVSCRYRLLVLSLLASLTKLPLDPDSRRRLFSGIWGEFMEDLMLSAAGAGPAGAGVSRAHKNPLTYS